MEALRLAKKDRKTCCHILAYHTAPHTKKDLFDQKAVTTRRNFFEKELTDEEMATMLIVALTSDKTDIIMRHLGLDEEKKRMAKFMEIKRRHDTNNMSFGGLSVFGTFIGQLKEMGYSDDEILFEKGYEYLRLMLADKVTSIYLTDDEKNEVPALDSGGIDASDPANAQKILNTLKAKKVKAE